MYIYFSELWEMKTSRRPGLPHPCHCSSQEPHATGMSKGMWKAVGCSSAGSVFQRQAQRAMRGMEGM